QGSSVCRLVTTVAANQDSWLLWIEDRQRTAFQDSEAAALVVVAQTLGRWLAQAVQPRWVEQLARSASQTRIEIIAEVPRRLAHDFGTALTGILGFPELALAQQIPANTSLHSYLEEVYRAAQAGAQFTHQLRLFSRRQSASSRSSLLPALLA